LNYLFFIFLPAFQQLAMALDEVFSVVAGEMGYIMDEADKDMMVGEWFEDY